MSQTVSIPANHFIGKGDTPFLIEGRIIGDDEDTATLILADSLGEAESLFVDHLHEEADNDDDARAELVAEHGSDYIITKHTILT